MGVNQRLTFSVGAMVVALGILSGCGSSSKSAAPPASTTTTSPLVSTPATVKATGGGRLCSQLATYINSASSLGASPTPAQVKASFQQAETVGQEALGEAPSSIKADLQIVLDATKQYVAALAKVNYNLASVPAATSNSTLGTPQVIAADKVVDTYVQNTCGISTP